MAEIGRITTSSCGSHQQRGLSYVLINVSRASVLKPSAEVRVWLQVPSLRTFPLEQPD